MARKMDEGDFAATAAFLADSDFRTDDEWVEVSEALFTRTLPF